MSLTHLLCDHFLHPSCSNHKNFCITLILHFIRSLMLAIAILVPLFGLTWVFGLLTINYNTTVFAWIFTILNSLQVMHNHSNSKAMHVSRLSCNCLTKKIEARFFITSKIKSTALSVVFLYFKLCFSLSKGVAILFFRVIRSEQVSVMIYCLHIIMSMELCRYNISCFIQVKEKMSKLFRKGKGKTVSFKLSSGVTADNLTVP